MAAAEPTAPSAELKASLQRQAEIVAAESENETVNVMVKAAEAKLANTPEALHQQARDLLELRREHKIVGDALPRDRKEYFEALQHRHEKIGLIPNDIHGPEFLRGVEEFPQLSPAKKKAWIGRFASTNHEDAGRKFISLLKNEKDFEMRSLLRQTAMARGWPIKYPGYANDLMLEMTQRLPKTDRGRSRLYEELRGLDEKALTAILERQKGPMLQHAVKGLVGRDLEFIRSFVRSPEPTVRYGAMMALDGRFVGMQATKGKNAESNLLLLQRGLRDKEPRVRAAAARALSRHHTEDAAALLRTALNDPDRNVVDMAVSFWTGPRTSGARRPNIKSIDTSRLPLYQNDQELVREIMEAKTKVRRNQLIPLLANREPAVIEKLLKADDPELRLSVVQMLKRATHRAGDENLLLLQRVMKNDPVEDIRTLALEALEESSGMNASIRKEMHRVSLKDESANVREAARESLVMRSDDGRHVLYVDGKTETERAEAALKAHYGDLPVRHNEIFGLNAAFNVYDAPEFETARTARALVDSHKKFVQSVPPGYEVVELMTDPRSGFKGAIYKPTTDKNRPLIFSIAGTQTVSDTLADVNMGLAQASSGMLNRFNARALKEIGRWDGEIIVTGHSLGGAVAQVMGHELRAALLANPELRAKADALKVLTWNGLGGMDALKRSGRYKPEIAAGLQATNYYLTKDKIVKVGTHVGSMVQIPSGKFGESTNALKAHGIGEVRKSIAFGGFADGDVIRETFQARLPLLAHAAKVIGPISDLVQLLRYKWQARQILQTLGEAKVLWASEEGYKRMRHTYDWLGPELEEITSALKKPEHQERVKQFRAILDEKLTQVKQFRRKAVSKKDHEIQFANDGLVIPDIRDPQAFAPMTPTSAAPATRARQ